MGDTATRAVAYLVSLRETARAVMRSGQSPEQALASARLEDRFLPPAGGRETDFARAFHVINLERSLASMMPPAATAAS
jgi:hypothetical protein